MQSQQTQSTNSSTSKTRYWIAAVIVLFITSASLALFFVMQNQDFTNFKTTTATQISDVNQQLREANELVQQRQEEINLSKEQQQTLQGELLASLAANKDLTKQVSESKTETTNQSERADIAEEQQKIDAASSDMQRMLLYYTYSRLYREQEENPQYPAIDLLDYITGRVKTFRNRRSPQAEARIRLQISRLYSTLHNYNNSQLQAELAYKIRKKQLGEDHPDTLIALTQLSDAYYRQGNYKLSVDNFNQVLARTRKQYGDDHKETLRVLERLIPSLAGLKQYDDLVTAWQEILRIQQIHFSKQENYLYSSMLYLGKALRKAGRYEEAEAIFRNHLKTCLELKGLDDKSTFEAKVCLAWTLRLQDKIEEAERLHKELAPLAIFMFNSNKPFADDCYGRYLTYLGEFESAERHLLRNYRPKPNSLFTVEGVDINPAVDALIELYEAWWKPEEADKMRKQLVMPGVNAG